MPICLGARLPSSGVVAMDSPGNLFVIESDLVAAVIGVQHAAKERLRSRSVMSLSGSYVT